MARLRFVVAIVVLVPHDVSFWEFFHSSFEVRVDQHLLWTRSSRLRYNVWSSVQGVRLVKLWQRFLKHWLEYIMVTIKISEITERNTPSHLLLPYLLLMEILDFFDCWKVGSSPFSCVSLTNFVVEVCEYLINWRFFISCCFKLFSELVLALCSLWHNRVVKVEGLNFVVMTVENLCSKLAHLKCDK